MRAVEAVEKVKIRWGSRVSGENDELWLVTNLAAVSSRIQYPIAGSRYDWWTT